MIPIPDPLHPAVVHLPIALAVLIPVLAAAFVLAIATGRLPARAWLRGVTLVSGRLLTRWPGAKGGPWRSSTLPGHGCAVVAFGGTIDLASVATVQRTRLRSSVSSPMR